jgi:peptidase M28-like protein
MAGVQQLRSAIEHLASIDRASCSAGEGEAAEWIAAALRDEGLDARVELERVHGSYWWPLGIPSALAIAGVMLARRGRRVTGAGLGALGAAAVVDDLSAGRRWLRRVLPKRTTANVVAEAGDRDADRTLVLVAHHDAAHTSIFFNPAITEWVGDLSQPAPGQPPRMPALMLPIAAGPALAGAAVLAGARRLATLAAWICAGIVASFAEIALQPTVPGANDNLTGVATVLGIARALSERPLSGLRVMLVSTGSEEALMEGMWAFARRHFPALPADRTHLLCVDTVGSPHLVLAEAEGMLQLRDYDADFKELVAESARELGVDLRRGMKMRFGTDGLLALRHGIPAAMLTSVNEHGSPSNYHWPTDTPDRLDYARLADAVTLCEAVMRRLAAA